MKNLLIVALLPFLLSGCFRTRADIAKEKEEREARAAMQQSAAEYQQNSERLQAEIGRLQGKMEELEHQRKKEMSSYSSTSEGNSKSVTEMKTQMEEMQKTQGLLFEEIKRLKEENLQLVKTMPKSSSLPPAGEKKKVSSGGGNSYQNAFAAYNAKDYEAAADGFRTYLQLNPKGKRQTDARFFLGESLFRQKEYADAIVEYAVIHEAAPASALGRKSTLKIAQSFKALGKDKDAKAFAQILVQSSPNSAEAKQARKILK
jgi:TolA-binding protein